MNDEIREQVSALLDDELSDLERPLLVARLERDVRLRECLGRYELIGEVMRCGGIGAAPGVAGRVQRALEHEPAAAAARSAVKLWKPVAGLAVAGSVALAAILTVTAVRDSDSEKVPPVALGERAAPLTGSTTGGGLPQQWNRIQPQLDQRLSGYLVNHNEYAASHGVQGVMPYVRIVGYENGQR